MVSRVEEAITKVSQNKCPQQQQKHQQLGQCNKGKARKLFKRSSSNIEEDGLSSAILYLACIAYTTTPSCPPC
ncbi:hypothetical protein Leryth_019310 [Lithospermum erythrorhizon]|uniref:Uncharacterized protein n=1 Tax=Lithospermum erythrorhizon TaxID=34254 RepID=A0AAV3NX14_LITER|nr:hypothetical protein Leryth_019310 [Lithospermum erythrorhizon]